MQILLKHKSGYHIQVGEQTYILADFFCFQIFRRLTTSSLQDELLEITMLLYPVKSMFEGLPGPKELYLFIEVALVEAVEEPRLREPVVQLMETLSCEYMLSPSEVGIFRVNLIFHIGQQGEIWELY